jgi:hypothetical protein
MNAIAKTPALLALLTASWLFSPTSGADPVHKFGNEGSWIHMDSGWRFPLQVSNFKRVLQPYTIDGNNDAGVEYRQTSAPNASAVVEVYAADSAAPDAQLDGAKATAAQKVGAGVRVESEKPFQIDAQSSMRGVKVTYTTEATEPTGLTNLYFFATDRWHVKVLASAPSSGAATDEAVEALVRALPWDTLGTDPDVPGVSH